MVSEKINLITTLSRGGRFWVADFTRVAYLANRLFDDVSGLAPILIKPR